MGIKKVLDSTKIDEALVDFLRTFLSVSIAVALGLGIPILSIDGEGYKAIISAGLASGLQVIMTYLDPSNDRYGITK
jgi:hypothetical protein